MSLRSKRSARNLHPVDSEVAVQWTRWTQDRNPIARETLIIEFLPLVHRIAGRMHRSIPPQVSLDDLRSWGTMGLIRAVEHYDPGTGAACGNCGRCGSSRGTAFPTYAANAIRGVILDEIRSLDWAPRRVRKRQRSIEEAREDIEGVLGRSIVETEIAVVLKWAPHDVTEALQETERARTHSLDEPSDDDEGRSTWVADPRSDTFREASTNVLLEALVETVLNLPVQQQVLLSLVYFEGCSLTEAANRMGITANRAKELQVLATVGLHSRARELVSA